MYLSVVTPYLNGEKFIEKFSRAFINQTLCKDKFELILIDNGSSDDSSSLLQANLQASINYKIIEYHTAESSYEARNHGAKFAKGDVLVFTDIDCIPDPNWLLNIYSSFSSPENNPMLLVGGVNLFFLGCKPNVFELFDLKYFLGQENYAKEKTGVTANLAVTKSLFDSALGFKAVKSGGDKDFCRRVALAGGYHFKYSPECLIWHPARSTHSELVKKIQRVSDGKISLVERRSFSLKFYLFFKTLIALVLQPKQVKECLSVIFDSDYTVGIKFKFLKESFVLGFYARYILFKGYLRAMLK